MQKVMAGFAEHTVRQTRDFVSVLVANIDTPTISRAIVDRPEFEFGYAGRRIATAQDLRKPVTGNRFIGDWDIAQVHRDRATPNVFFIALLYPLL
jgi:hypothetical protein